MVSDRLDCRLRIGTHNQLEIVSSSSCPSQLLNMIDPYDPHASRDALWVLWKLSHNQLIKQKLCAVDGVATMLGCLHGGEPEVVRYALRVLYNLSFEQQARPQIRHRDGVSTILQCLEFDPAAGEDLEATRYALRTLCNLAAEDGAEIYRLGCLGLVADCTATHDPTIMHDALELLGNLCADGPSCQVVIAHPSLLSVLQAQLVSADDKIRNCTLVILLRVSSHASCLLQLTSQPQMLAALLHTLSEPTQQLRLLAARCVGAACRLPQMQMLAAAANSQLLQLLHSEFCEPTVMCHVLVAVERVLGGAHWTTLQADEELDEVLTRHLADRECADQAAAALLLLQSKRLEENIGRNKTMRQSVYVLEYMQACTARPSQLSIGLRIVALQLPAQQQTPLGELGAMRRRTHLALLCGAACGSCGGGAAVQRVACNIVSKLALHRPNRAVLREWLSEAPWNGLVALNDQTAAASKARLAATEAELCKQQPVERWLQSDCRPTDSDAAPFMGPRRCRELESRQILVLQNDLSELQHGREEEYNELLERHLKYTETQQGAARGLLDLQVENARLLQELGSLQELLKCRSDYCAVEESARKLQEENQVLKDEQIQTQEQADASAKSVQILAAEYQRLKLLDTKPQSDTEPSWLFEKVHFGGASEERCAAGDSEDSYFLQLEALFAAADNPAAVALETIQSLARTLKDAQEERQYLLDDLTRVGQIACESNLEAIDSADAEVVKERDQLKEELTVMAQERTELLQLQAAHELQLAEAIQDRQVATSVVLELPKEGVAWEIPAKGVIEFDPQVILPLHEDHRAQALAESSEMQLDALNALTEEHKLQLDAMANENKLLQLDAAEYELKISKFDNKMGRVHAEYSQMVDSQANTSKQLAKVVGARAACDEQLAVFLARHLELQARQSSSSESLTNIHRRALDVDSQLVVLSAEHQQLLSQFSETSHELVQAHERIQVLEAEIIWRSQEQPDNTQPSKHETSEEAAGQRPEAPATPMTISVLTATNEDTAAASCDANSAQQGSLLIVAQETSPLRSESASTSCSPLSSAIHSPATNVPPAVTNKLISPLAVPEAIRELVDRFNDAAVIGDVLAVQEMTPQILCQCATTHGSALVQSMVVALQQSNDGTKQPVNVAILVLMLAVADRSIEALANTPLDPILRVACSPEFSESRLLGTDLLGRLSVDATVRAAIRTKGVIPLLLLNLVHKQDPALSLATTRLFVNLSVSNKNKKTIAQASGVALFVEQLSTTNNQLLHASVRVLANLVSDKLIHSEIVQHGGLNLLAATLSKFSEENDLVGLKYSVKTIRMVTESFDGKAVQAGVHDALFAVLDHAFASDDAGSAETKTLREEMLRSLLHMINHDTVRAGCCAQPTVLTHVASALSHGMQAALLLVRALCNDAVYCPVLVANGVLWPLLHSLANHADWAETVLEIVIELGQLEEGRSALAAGGNAPALILECWSASECPVTMTKALFVLSPNPVLMQMMIAKGSLEYAAWCLAQHSTDTDESSEARLVATQLLQAMSLEQESESRALQCGVLKHLLLCASEERWAEREVLDCAVGALCNLTLGRQCCEEAFSQGATHIAVNLLAARQLDLSHSPAKLLRNLLSVNVLDAADAQSVATAMVNLMSSDNSDGTQHAIQCLRLVTQQSCDCVTNVGTQLLQLLCAMFEVVNAETQESAASIMLFLATHPSASFDCTIGPLEVQHLVFQIEGAQNTSQSRTVALLARVLWLFICCPEREHELRQMEQYMWVQCTESIDRICVSLMTMPLSSDMQGDAVGPDHGLPLVHLLGIAFLCAEHSESTRNDSHWQLVGRTVAQSGHQMHDWKQLYAWVVTARKMPRQAWPSFIAAQGASVLEAVLNSGIEKLVCAALQFALDVAEQGVPQLLACVERYADNRLTNARTVRIANARMTDSLSPQSYNPNQPSNGTDLEILERPTLRLSDAFSLWQARMHTESILRKSDL